MAKKKDTELKSQETEKSQEKTTALLETVDENKPEDVTDKSAELKEPEKTLEKSSALSAEPVALLVRLRDIHPQASYGRAGFRFNKETAVRLALVDLTQAQLDKLVTDPWLEIEGLME